MSSDPRMSTRLPGDPSQTEPKKGLQLVGDTVAQPTLPGVPLVAPRSLPDWLKLVYAALQKGVREGFTKQGDFADEVACSNRDTSLKLRRAPCDKGYPQIAPLDWIAQLGHRSPAALVAYLQVLAAAVGHKLVPVEPPKPEQLVRILAADLSETRRRQLETEHALPPGSLS